MPTTPFALRRATSDDADAIAEVHSASFRLVTVRETRRKHPTFATGGNPTRTIDGRPGLTRGVAGVVLRADYDGFARFRLALA
jgi:hypothetical protein